MSNLIAMPASKAAERENWRLVAEVQDELYMEGWLGPGDFALNGAGVVDDATNNFPYTILPDGITSRMRKTFKTRQRWHRCGLYVKVWYTSNVGSVNTFDVTVGARQARVGANVNAGPFYDLFTGNLTVPGPAVAQDILTFEYTSAPALVSSYYDLLGLRFGRAGAADANNNEYWQLLAYYKFLESS